MYFLGIDIGSSFLKSSVLDLKKRRVLPGRSTPTPEFAEFAADGRPLRSGYKEIDIRSLAAAVGDLIESAAAQYKLAGVGFSVQMHGFILFGTDGTPLTHYVSWQDLRGTIPNPEEPQELSVLESLRGEEWKPYFEENGVKLRPNHSVIPLMHYKAEHGIPDGAQFAMIGDAVARVLTGTRAWIHPTNAQSSGLYSVKTNDWNRELIEKLGLGGLDFPEVKDLPEPVAVYHSKKGDIPLYAALGDQQATVLGIGVKPGDAFINISTGGQIGYATDDPTPGDYETRPYFAGNYIRTITQLPSGRTINIQMRFIKHIGREVFGETGDEAALEMKVWDFIDSIDYERIRAVPLGMDFSYFDPQGGAVTGITGDNFSIENLIASAYGEFAAQYAEKAGQLGVGADSGAGEVICTGGVIRKNKPLFKKLSTSMPLPCRIAEAKEDSMEGILSYARWCLMGDKLM